MNGIINVLKPSNMTSHDVVSFLRRTLGIKKIGHTGTLDPNAAGVLPVCIGKATRVAEYFNDAQISKTYIAEMTLGKSTDTQDKYGKIIKKDIKKKYSQEDFENILSNFRGKINQIPPMYSAKKINGKKLYEYAREGLEIKRKSREVEIYKLNLLKNLCNEKFFIEVDCSSGTYIRTLCNDIAKHMGTEGYMSFLLRTRVGQFKIIDSLTLEEIEIYSKSNSLGKYLNEMDYPLSYIESLVLDDKFFSKITNGIKISIDEINQNIQPKEVDKIRVYCKNRFIGIGLIENNRLKMKKVLI